MNALLRVLATAPSWACAATRTANNNILEAILQNGDRPALSLSLRKGVDCLTKSWPLQSNGNPQQQRVRCHSFTVLLIPYTSPQISTGCTVLLRLQALAWQGSGNTCTQIHSHTSPPGGAGAEAQCWSLPVCRSAYVR